MLILVDPRNQFLSDKSSLCCVAACSAQVLYLVRACLIFAHSLSRKLRAQQYQRIGRLAGVSCEPQGSLNFLFFKKGFWFIGVAIVC